MSSKAEPRQPFRDAVARRLERITWKRSDDVPTPSELLREYVAELEAEALRIQRRAEEIDDTLAIMRQCLAALPGSRPGVADTAGGATTAEPATPSEWAPVGLVRRADPQAEPLPALRVWMLGDFRLSIGDTVVRPASSTRVWQVLKFLVTRGGGPVAPDVLADAFWRRSSPAAALQSVYSVVHALRRLLCDLHPGEYVVSHGGFYSLAPGAEISSDVAYFRGRMESASKAEARGDREEACVLLTEAVGAYSGEYLPDDVYERWAAEEREALAAAHLRALERLARYTEEAGMDDQAADYRLRILQCDPLREESHRALIRYHLASGQRAQAIRQYRELEDILARELGIEPDPDTRALLKGLLPG